MSAFVVSHKHINTILTFAATRKNYAVEVRHLSDGSSLDLSDRADLQKAADILYGQNVRSVSHRYNDEPANQLPGVITEVGHAITYRMILPTESAVQIIKACDCLGYQSCETDDWEQTDAYKIMTAIRERATEAIPGMDSAKWSID